MTGSFRLRIGIISVVIGGNFGGGDHFDGGDHFGGGTELTASFVRKTRGGGYSTDAWVGRCGPGIQTLTLFKIQFSDFPIPFKTDFKIFRPYLRHLNQNHILFKTRMK